MLNSPEIVGLGTREFLRLLEAHAKKTSYIAVRQTLCGQSFRRLSHGGGRGSLGFFCLAAQPAGIFRPSGDRSVHDHVHRCVLWVGFHLREKRQGVSHHILELI